MSERETDGAADQREHDPAHRHPKGGDAAEQSGGDKAKSPPDGEAIAEIGDQVGGPA